jgi:assimilatory nitrate reductase catalytic subunit
MSDTVRTTCPYCGVGCGVLATPLADGSTKIEGDPEHPANHGRLCVKGAALGETLDLRGRLLQPMLRGADGGLRPAGWDEALAEVAARFAATMREHGPESVALYVSGQLLTEDYYVANKLVKGWFGTGNIDTNSRLCMASAVAGHKRAFGADAVPLAYEDLELADLIVLVGSNLAWCHPVLYQRILAARAARPEMKLVVIDPRRTPGCELADLHLPIRPGSDVSLFNGLLAWLHREGLWDEAFLEAHASGAARAVEVAEFTTGSIDHVARSCGLAADDLRAFYALFAANARSITAFSQGVNQSSSGTDKVNAIINCHLLTGRIGKPGAGPFSITGQPNAMGGREAGGMATTLAAHFEFGDAAQGEMVRAYWGSPTIAARPGLKAVDLFEAVHAGRVKALWIMATNPAVSLPDADRVREALARCSYVVVSEVMAQTDTTRAAHVLLPAAAWSEKDGTVTNSERRISRQRAFAAPPGEARPDWWIVTQLARHMGYAAGFPYESAHEIFREHAGLSAWEQDRLPRAFDLSGLAGLDAAAYEALAPVQWPVRRAGAGTARLFADGRYFHADGRAKLIPVMPRAPAQQPDDDYPFVLNTGRLRDQWHTMSRTGKSPRLAAHRPEPALELHPRDALACGLRDGRLARLATRWGSAVLRVRTTTELARGQVFAPIHWTDRNASDARIGALANPVADPISGEPEFKHTPARVEPFAVEWYGFLLTRRELPHERLGTLAWWTRVEGARAAGVGRAHARIEFAGRERMAEGAQWSAWARGLLGAPEGADWIEASDAGHGLYRAVWLVEGRIEACVYVAPAPEALGARAWLSGLMAETATAPDRMALVAGRPATPVDDPGAIVCSCHAVGSRQILRAIAEGAHSTEALGARLRCGTNCGSCLPELRALLTTHALAEA